MTTDRDYPQMAATRGRIEPAPRRVRGYLGDELVFDTSAARYVWEVPYYPQYYIPLADVRAEFLRDENHPQKVQFGPSRLHSLVGAGQTYQSAARVFDADSDSPRGRHRAVRMGSVAVVRGRRADLRPPAQPVFAGRRPALAPARPGRARRCRAGRHHGLPCCCSKQVCPQGITSIRPISPSSIWNPARRRRCARTRE